MLTAMLCCLQGAVRAVEDDNKPEVEGVQLNVSTACCVHLALLPGWWAACAHWGLSAGPAFQNGVMEAMCGKLTGLLRPC